MTILAPLPIQQFKDGNGNPLAGGLLYTYAAGTSTAQSTYTDSTGVSANTNPIVLNSRGEAAVWLTGGLAYKFILQDAAANLIWSVDQISSPVIGGNPVTLASAATTDIGGQGSSAVEISGTTTITSLGTNYSGPRFVRFTGVLTLTYALPAINLPSAANITTAAGDVAIFYPNLALNGWNLMAYTKAAGLAAASGANSDITSLLQSSLTASVTATAAGSADAITASFTPAITTQTALMTLYVRAASANATTTPTFTPNSGTVTATVIVKGNGLPLAVGDIAGVGHVLCLQRDSVNSNWVLQNPANGVVVATAVKQIQSVLSSVASSALTCTLNATSLDFRSLTPTDGTTVTQAITSALSVVIPSGATLGTVSGVQARLVLVALYNTGGVNTKLGIINLAGGNNIDETSTLASSSLTTGSASANVCYSVGGSAAGAFRVVGYVDITQAAAGTWATAPIAVQGGGGQALAAMSTFGFGADVAERFSQPRSGHYLLQHNE